MLFRVVLALLLYIWGYWSQRADERLGDPPPLLVRDRDGNPQEDPLAVHCFCVAGVHCLEISLGLADPGNVICLSC